MEAIDLMLAFRTNASMYLPPFSETIVLLATNSTTSLVALPFEGECNKNIFFALIP